MQIITITKGLFLLLFFFFYNQGHSQLNPCEFNTCENGGICNFIPPSSFSCNCTEFFLGDQCEINGGINIVLPTSPVVYKNDIDVALDDSIFISGFTGGTANLGSNGPSDWTLTFTITGGTLKLGTTNITFGGDGNNSSSFTATGQAETLTFEESDLNIALNEATFTPTPDLFGTNVASISFSAVYGPSTSNGNTITFDIQDSTLSSENLNFENNIKLFPIPVNNTLYISNTTNHIISEVQIINLLGKTVSKINYNTFNPKLNLDVTDLEAGIYFIKISKVNYTFNRKIILN